MTLDGFAILRSPRQVMFGRGVINAVGALAAECGRRALVCTDSHIGGTEILPSVVNSIEAAGVKVEVFAGAAPDLPVGVLDEALTAAVTALPDFVVGLGGGSSIDLAKLTALLLRHPAPIEQYYGENRVPGAVCPIIAIPTTAGTGSEVTPVAVVSDPKHALKVGISSRFLVPTLAICDPSLTDGCPATVSAHAGIDALAHAIEAYTAVARSSEAPDELAVSRVFVGKNMLSDAFALEAIGRIGANLARAVRDPGDRVARDGMAYGSLLAGLAFATAGTSAAHALQYPLGARTSTPHGLGIGLLLPYVMEFNRPTRTAEFAAIVSALRPDFASESTDEAARATVDFVAKLTSAIGIPQTLAELGVGWDELECMARQAAGVTRLVENNPRPLDIASLLTILQAAWSGDRTRLAEPTSPGVPT